MKKILFFFSFVLAMRCFAGDPPSTTDAVVFTNDCIVYTLPSGTWSLADNYWLTNTWVRDGSGNLITDFSATSLITNFVQRGNGTLRVWWLGDGVGKSRVFSDAVWTVQQGVLSVQQSGTTSIMNNKANLNIRLCEGAQLLLDSDSTSGFYPCGHLTLQGASVVGERGLQKAAKALTANTTLAKNTTFEDPLPSVQGLFMNGTLTVLPSALESVIDAPYLLVGSAGLIYPTVFNVQEGATLRIRSCLADDLASHDGSSTNRVQSGFLKTGKGTLVLTQPSALSGTVVIQDGTVVLEKYADFGNAQLIVADNAKVVLANGAVLKTYGTVSQWPTVLQDAAIHVDAMAYASQTGTTVNPLRNFGTVGGAFARTAGGTYAAVQADAFGTGRPGLSLGGGSAYRLTGFTNTAPQITLFAVMKRTAKDQWGGPFSFSSLTATNGDNGAVRAWYLENSGTNASGNFAYMDVQYNKNQLVQLNNAFAWDAPLMAMAYTWGGGSNSTNVFMQRTLTQTMSNTNNSGVAFTVSHDMLYLWSRSSSYGNSMNAFSGVFGELLVYFRTLTPAEITGVQDYLMNKWFGAPLTANQAPLTVTVNTNDTASLAIPPVATVKKAGGGTLSLSAVGAAATNLLSLDEGTLRFAESVIHRKAEIWVDPSDASSLATNGSGRVTAALNKGRCGGTWVPNTTGPTLGTTYTPLRTAFEFQGAQTLKLQSFLNTAGESNQAMSVFTVLVRSSDLGAWSGAFVFAPSLALLTSNEDLIRQRLLYESADGTQRDYVCGGGGLSQLITLTGDPALPYLVALEEAPKSFLLSAEWASGYGCETNALFGFTKARENRSLEFVQLGARVTTGYAPRCFWKGAVGEFLTFNCELTKAEKKAVMDYLRMRWLGTGVADPDKAPDVIAGVQPDEASSASLILSAGTKVEQATKTQSVKNLTVGEGVTFERSGVTTVTDFALFDISNALFLPSSVSLNLLSLPDENAKLFTYGTKSGTPSWAISGEGTRTCSVVDRASDKAVWLIRNNGTLLLMK
jgi:autotransporter-associated beta strand protein